LKPQIKDDAPRALDDLRLISFSVVCDTLNICSWTLHRWIKRGLFPAPIHLTPTSPAKFRVRDIEAHLEKRRRGRRVKRAPRGVLKQRVGVSVDR
jgi:predicted site-specific integrase-resolvase